MKERPGSVSNAEGDADLDNTENLEWLKDEDVAE